MEDTGQWPSSNMTKKASTPSSSTLTLEQVCPMTEASDLLEPIRLLIDSKLKTVRQHFDSLEEDRMKAAKIKAAILQFNVERAVGAKNFTEAAKRETSRKIENSINLIYENAQDRLNSCRILVESAFKDLLMSIDSLGQVETGTETDGQNAASSKLFQRQENGVMDETNSNNTDNESNNTENNGPISSICSSNNSVSSDLKKLSKGDFPIDPTPEAFKLTFPNRAEKSEDMETMYEKNDELTQGREQMETSQSGSILQEGNDSLPTFSFNKAASQIPSSIAFSFNKVAKLVSGGSSSSNSSQNQSPKFSFVNSKHEAFLRGGGSSSIPIFDNANAASAANTQPNEATTSTITLSSRAISQEVNDTSAQKIYSLAGSEFSLVCRQYQPPPPPPTTVPLLFPPVEEPAALNLGCSTVQAKVVVPPCSSLSFSVPEIASETKGSGGVNHPPKLQMSFPSVENGQQPVECSEPALISVKSEEEIEEEIQFLFDVQRTPGNGVAFASEEETKPIIEQAEVSTETSVLIKEQQLPNQPASLGVSEPVSFEAQNTTTNIKSKPVTTARENVYFLSPSPPNHSSTFSSASMMTGIVLTGQRIVNPLHQQLVEMERTTSISDSSPRSQAVHANKSNRMLRSTSTASRASPQTLSTASKFISSSSEITATSPPLATRRRRSSSVDEDSRKYKIISTQCLVKGCNKVEVAEDGWDHHKHTFNESKGRFICLSALCKRMVCFTDQKGLDDHIKAGHKKFNEACVKCEEVFIFTDYQQFEDHVRTFHVKGQYSCTSCGETFELVKEVLKHWNAKHDNWGNSSPVAASTPQKRVNRG